MGANDGLVSTESLVVGDTAAGSGRPKILIAGVAGVVRWCASGPDPRAALAARSLLYFLLVLLPLSACRQLDRGVRVQPSFVGAIASPGTASPELGNSILNVHKLAGVTL